MRKPFRGLVLVKRPQLVDRIGSIVLLDKTVEGYTAGQAEVVAVGPPAIPEDLDEPIPDADPRLHPGAWVLCRYRSWIGTDRPDEFLVRQSDVIGVFTAAASGP